MLLLSIVLAYVLKRHYVAVLMMIFIVDLTLTTGEIVYLRA